MGDVRGRWIRRYRAAPEATATVVCLPHAGGSGGYYRPLALALPPSIELPAVQYPGRQDRVDEPFAADFAELADRTAAAVRAEVDGPVALFGHSMGALLAFEVARRLEAVGIVPLALFASAARPPGRPLRRHLHTASDAELVQELAALDGTADILLENEDIRALVLPPLRADYRLLEGYRYDGSRLTCPVVSMTGDADRLVSAEEAAEWAACTTGPFDLHVFPGGHFYLADQWDAVSTTLTKHLSTTAG